MQIMSSPAPRRRTRFFLWALLLCSALLTFATLSAVKAELPVIRLYAAFPPGGQQGTPVELTLASGADLEEASRLHFSHPGITAEQKTKQEEGKEEPQSVPNQFMVKIAPDVPPGLYELRAIGRFGISNPRAFVVGDRPEVVENDANNTLAEAQEVALGSIVNGRSNNGADLDFFKFSATQGQRIIMDCWAQRIDSRMDATLVLFDAEGRELDYSRDFNRLDPLLDFVVPADGVYVVKLYDFLYAGSNDHFYRLSMGTTPYIDSVMPPAAAPGTKQEFVLYGRNLPGGSTSELSVDGKPLEQLSVEIEVPAHSEQEPLLDVDSLLAPAASELDGFSYTLASPEGSSNPVFIGFAHGPVAMEQEPNDAPSEAQAVALPCELAGRLQQPGDRDWISFEAKKGETYWIESISDRLGLSTDPFFVLQRVTSNDKGEESVSELRAEDDVGNVGGLFYDTSTQDFRYRFVVPDDGTYRLVVQDRYYQARGSPLMVYRVAIRPEKPDFRLVAYAPFPVADNQTPSAWANVLRKGGTGKLGVLALRQDNFGGPIEVTVEGLPEGVSCPPAMIAPGQNATSLVFTAAEDAADWSGEVRVWGKAKIGESEVVRAARAGTVLWPGMQPNVSAQARTSRNLTLGVVSETAPFLVKPDADQITLPQSHQLNIPLKVTRRGDFKAQMTFTAEGLPGNVLNESVTLKEGESEATLHLFVNNNAPTGTFTFHVQATTQVPYTKDPEGKNKKAQKVLAPSTPISLTIMPGPVTLAPKVPNKGAIKKGGKIEIPVTVNRRNGFKGPVTLELVVPPEVTGVSAEPVTVPADQNEGTLVVQAAEDATEGNHKYVAVRAKMQWDGKPADVDQTIPLNVQK